MNNNRQFFGTDGIRGVAGEPPLDPPTVYAAGLALGDDLARGGPASVVLGQDTRASGVWIAETLAAGLEARGIGVAYAGVLPTPGVAFLAAHRAFAAGIVVSASHNPFADNGIKLFGPSGFKLPDAEEAAIERSILQYLDALPAPPRRLPLIPDPALPAAYIEHLRARFAATDFSGLKVMVDCAHGAAAAVAPALFASLGLEVVILADRPDGRNINAGVGALHPQALAAAVRDFAADAGVALDGDADRAIFVDASGQIVDGDSVLLLAARELRAQGRLRPAVVVGTVMTNLGLEQALARESIRLERAPVGDKYVLEKMQALGAVLGGEPSGHVIFAHEASTGDGLLTALHCFDLMARRRLPLSQLCDGWTVMPQKIVNVPVREKTPLDQLPPVQAAIAAAKRHFGAHGRVLVRYSGTEKLARVMVEAPSAAEVQHHADSIAAALRSTLGA